MRWSISATRFKGGQVTLERENRTNFMKGECGSHTIDRPYDSCDQCPSCSSHDVQRSGVMTYAQHISAAPQGLPAYIEKIPSMQVPHLNRWLPRQSQNQ